MSRKKRIWYPGASYHVMSRGNRRTVLFKDASDYIRFLGCIASSKERYGSTIESGERYGREIELMAGI